MLKTISSSGSKMNNRLLVSFIFFSLFRDRLIIKWHASDDNAQQLQLLSLSHYLVDIAITSSGVAFIFVLCAGRYFIRQNQRRFGIITAIGWNVRVLNRLQWPRGWEYQYFNTHSELGDNPDRSRKVIYADPHFVIQTIMNRLAVYGLGLAVLLTATGAGQVWAQYGGEQSVQRATPEQIEECKRLGIPEFSCTEQTLLAKRRIGAAAQEGAYGSGTAMLSQTFGDMGAIIAALAAIFGGVAAAFFAKSRVGKKAQA
jgi:hypothetical protein